MQLMRYTLALLVLAIVPSAARATTVTYSFTEGGFDNGGTLSGTFSGDDALGYIDQTTLTSLTVSFTGDPTFGDFTLDISDPTRVLNSFYYSTSSLNAGGDNGPYFSLTSPKFTIDTTGSQKGVAGSVSDDREGIVTVTSEFPVTGQIANTPEPSSLLLLSTGALGVAGAVRRKFAAQA